MFPGMGRGMNSKKMKALMKQMGIDIEEMEGVDEVVIKTHDKEIVFRDPDVTIMTAQGVETYQVVGAPEEREREVEVPEGDVDLVVEQTGASPEEARDALRETGGDLAEAIVKLSEE